jgi:caffeoyl-CoA O-methyltransferase
MATGDAAVEPPPRTDLGPVQPDEVPDRPRMAPAEEPAHLGQAEPARAGLVEDTGGYEGPQGPQQRPGMATRGSGEIIDVTDTAGQLVGDAKVAHGPQGEGDVVTRQFGQGADHLEARPGAAFGHSSPPAARGIEHHHGVPDHNGVVIVRPAIERYASDHTSPEPRHLTALAEETRGFGEAAHMMVGPVVGRFLALLVHAIQPRLVLELGTFTGYSTLAMAECLPPEGRIVSCEIDPGRAEVARRHLAASPWRDRVEVRVGPALEVIAALDGPFDLVFVDADKERYCQYFDALVPKLAPAGLMVVDNSLHLGRVIAEHDRSVDICAIRSFNNKVRDDRRVEQVVLTIRQGMTLIRRVSRP